MQRPQPETVTLDDILITEELSRRSPRSPNLQAENQALHTLARQLVNQPEIMLQSVVDIVLDLCSPGTAGVSLLEVLPNGEEIFRAHVLAGTLAQYVGGSTPRNFSPWVVCLERGAPVLFSHPERYFTYFQEAKTPIVEGLVLPLIADNQALGSIWIMSHDEQRHFDAEDVRVMMSLADFTAATLLLNQRQTQELLAKNAQLEAEIFQRKLSEERTHALIANLPGGAAFVVDRDLRYLLADGEALYAAGFKPEDLVGKTIFEVLPRELAAYYEPLYRKALAGELFEHEHHAHDRSYVSRGTPLRAENGEIYAVLAVSYDITERKQSEAALRESEENFRTFVNASSDIVYKMSADWSVMQSLVGKQFIPSTVNPSRNWLATYIPEDEQPRVQAAIEQAIRTKRNFELEHRVIREDGTIGWTFSRAIPLLNEQGDIVEWFGAASDVTKRKQAEIALRESEARLAVELADAKQLQFISSQLIHEENIDALYEQILDAAIALMRSDMGSMQMLHPDSNELQLLIWKGFDPASAAFWQWVRVDSESSCGLALKTGERSIIPDVEACEFVAGSGDLDAFRRSGIRAVQTTPLVSRSGRVVGMISTHWQEPHQPSERELGLLDVLARQAADLIEQRQAEAALRESEAKYRSLFNSMDEAYAVVEVMSGENGEWNDFLFLEVNPAFVKQTGMEYPVGRKATELLGTPNPQWAQVYGRVAETGEPIRFEEDEATLGRVFDLYVFRLGGEGSRRVAVLFTDITDRKRVEDERKRTEAAIAADLRDTQLLRDLGARLIIEGDIQSLYQEIMTVAMTLMQSDAGTVQILDEATQELLLLATQGFEPPMTEHFYRVDARSNTPCGRALAAGERIFMDFDVPQSEDPDGSMRMHVEAGYLSAQSTPLISRSGKPIGMVSTHWRQRYRPSDRELQFFDLLARQAADLIEQRQAEAAKHGAQESLQIAVEAAEMGTWDLDLTQDSSGRRSLRQDQVFGYDDLQPEWGQEIARRHVVEADLEIFDAAFARALETGELKFEVRVRWSDGSIHWMACNGRFYFDADGKPVRGAGVNFDITDRKRTEKALRESEEQQAFLLKFSDALRTEPDADTVANRALRMLFEQMQLDRCYIGVYRLADDRGDFTHQVGNDRVPPLPDGVRLSDFPEALKVAFDRTLVIDDIAETEGLSDMERQNLGALGMRALVAATLREGENNPLWAIVAISASSRCWTRGEVALLEEATERTWVAMERARTEAALRESEAKYRSLFESIDEGFCLIEIVRDETGAGVDYRLLEANGVFERQTGVVNATGKLASEYVPGEETFWLENFDRVARTGESARLENYHQPTKHWYTAFLVRVGGEDSNRVAIVFDDITDRKRTEEQLRRAAEMDAFRVKLSDALRSLSDPVQIQAEACRLLGEQLGVDRAYYVEVHEPEGYARVNQHYSRGDSPSIVGNYRLAEYGWSLPIMRRGETIVITDTQSSPVVPDHERAAMAAIQMVGFVALPLIKGEVLVGSLAVNEPTPREWTEAEVDLMRETAERIWADIQRAHAETALRESELQRIREQAAREEERQRAESLAELDRAKTLFFSNVSHEFRTPLTLSLAPLQDALSDQIYPLVPPQRERVELAHRNAIRLLKLVNTLLDFSRIEAGRMEAVYEATDLALLTTELASVFRSAIERAGLRLIVDCPPLPEPVYVDREMWEKIVLNLLSNAFKFSFAGEIAVRLHLADDHYVTLQVQDTGTGIAPEELPHLFERFYQVRGAKARTHEGSGIGLALVHELIRLHGGTVNVSSTVGQGTCFTVTIPLGTAHLPNDRIEATRTLVSTALGAAPYVEEARWLPEEAGEQGTANREELSTPSDSDPPQPCLKRGDNSAKVPLFKGDLGGSPGLQTVPSPSPARILLVDDNADMRDYLTRILSEHVQVEAVADGAAALAAAQERVPDLVLSDVMMPQMDGFELLKALRAEASTREVPIILLSARAGEESVIEGLQAGADDYLIKPFSATELVTRVLAHLQMAQLRLEALRQERTTSHRKDEMLSIVSHELNTPLVAILGWTRLLRTSPLNQSMLMKSLETIERNATLQAKLISDLLDISRITAGKVRLNIEPVELQSVIETAIASVNQTAQTKDIELSSLLEPLPTIIQGDPERLQQIVLNLLTNAVKFTPKGGRIEVCLDIVETQAQIKVSDTGCGITAEFLPYVFDHFRQGENSKSTKGLGLGLAIARHLVELHGGTISAESLGGGQGATFLIKFPLIDTNS